MLPSQRTQTEEDLTLCKSPSEFFRSFFCKSSNRSKNTDHYGWARYFDYFLVVTLYIIGFCLFFINMENINQKVRELEYPRWTKIIFGGLYGVLFLQIIRFLLENKI